MDDFISNCKKEFNMTINEPPTHSSDDMIRIIVRDEEALSQSEVSVLIQACKEYWEKLDRAGMEDEKAILINASRKIGIFSDD